MRVPILTLVHPNPEIDLYRELLSRGVLTISNFTGLGRNAVRLRVPQEIERLIGAIKTLD
ncbi:hypothetical protein D3C85_1539390 [compost metagenome]